MSFATITSYIDERMADEKSIDKAGHQDGVSELRSASVDLTNNVDAKYVLHLDTCHRSGYRCLDAPAAIRSLKTEP